MNYKIIYFRNKKELLRRQTNNRRIALLQFEHFCNNAYIFKNDEIIILLYYKEKRIKTFKKTIDK